MGMDNISLDSLSKQMETLIVNGHQKLGKFGMRVVELLKNIQAGGGITPTARQVGKITREVEKLSNFSNDASQFMSKGVTVEKARMDMNGRTSIAQALAMLKNEVKDKKGADFQKLNKRINDLIDFNNESIREDKLAITHLPEFGKISQDTSKILATPRKPTAPRVAKVGGKLQERINQKKELSSDSARIDLYIRTGQAMRREGENAAHELTELVEDLDMEKRVPELKKEARGSLIKNIREAIKEAREWERDGIDLMEQLPETLRETLDLLSDEKHLKKLDDKELVEAARGAIDMIKAANVPDTETTYLNNLITELSTDIATLSRK